MKTLSRRQTIALSTAAVGTSLLPTQARSGPIPNRSGLSWASGARTSNIDSFVALRKGRALDLLVNFGGHSTWNAMHNRYKSLQSLLDPTMGNRQETIVITYPTFPDSQSPRTGGDSVWIAAARGDFDFHHKVIADNLKRYPQKFIFRVGHEWNCCYPWRCFELRLAPNYIAYFRRIVDILRERHPTCLIDWCSIKRGKTEVSVANFYPGGDWVDFIGVDKYDMYPPLRNATEWAKDYNTTYKRGPQGIGKWLEYAKSVNRPLSIPEWAVNNSTPLKSYYGGDNPYFVSQMLKFFKDNSEFIGYECYFNGNNGTLSRDHLLDPAHNPQATKAYADFFAQTAR